ncbi:MAG: long-chain fatty acid--CoA ligase [Pseudomonadota bacterium]
MQFANVIALFTQQVERYDDKPWLWARDGDGELQFISWRDVAAQVTALGAAMRFHHVKKGDRVMLLAPNSPQWIIANLAIIKAGAISVPAYVTDTLGAHEAILRNVQAEYCVCAAQFLKPEFLAMAEDTGVKRIWVIGEVPEHTGSVALSRIKAAPQDMPGIKWPQLKRGDICTIIHTSGTSGNPRGVMLTHKSLLHNLAGVTKVWQDLPGFKLGEERFLSFLPLSHSYEYLAGQFVPMIMGAETLYVAELDRLLPEMQATSPTIMTAVPRFFEMVRGRILGQMARQNMIRQKLFFAALALGEKSITGTLGPGEKLLNALLDHLVRKRIAGRLGGSLKVFASGGGPLPYEIGMFFTALGVRILQGYGLSETSPVVSVNLPQDSRMGTVGPPLEGVDVMINPDGEILVRGDLLMKGYWGDEEATKQVIKHGWLHTGDIGKFDDGHLVITDRKKDIIVNSGGENIAPQRVEGILSLAAEIQQVMVYGDTHPFLVAVIVPDYDAIGKEDPQTAIIQAVQKGADNGLYPHERVRKFVIADGPFTIADGLMTPSMKIRRHKILEIYKSRLDALYRKDIVVKMNKSS